MRQIVYNSVKCLECNEVLVSRHRHDYVTCSCPNDAMVDGGNEYERYGAMDMTKIETHYVYADDDFEIVRKHATRGSRGKDGKQPLTWIAIADMNDDHLQAVLEYGGDSWHLDLIRREIAYRSSFLHQKLDKMENQLVEDPIVRTVIDKFHQRSQVGINKYGTMLNRKDLTTLEWLNHLQEELMDATLYIERLKQELSNITLK